MKPSRAPCPRSCGAARFGGLSALRRRCVVLAPGVLAGSVLAFAKAMGEFGATITFVSNIPGQTQTIPSAIYAFLQSPTGDRAATRLVVVSVVIALGALLVSEILARRVAKRVAGQ